jgi:uncharacterized protein (TIGR03437 family)
MADGSIQVTSPVAVSIVPGNPGIFSLDPSSNPRVAVAYHAYSNAHGVVSVDGTAQAGDIETITIGNRTYNYTTAPGDTLDTIRDNLVALINTDPQVMAFAAADFDRVLLLARVAGPEGNGIPYSTSASSGASTTMDSLGGPNSVLCCANIAGAPVTPQNPASSNETINVYATGLGLPVITPLNQGLINTGWIYPLDAPPTAPPDTTSLFVSSICGGSSADVLTSSLVPGSVGLFFVQLHLNPTLPTKWDTVCTIAQATYVSYPTTIQVQGPTGQ